MIKLPADLDVERLQREVRFDPSGRWINSRLLDLSLVDGREAPSRVTVRDDTLRSGANTPGVRATSDDKLRIAHELREAGIIEVEAGYPNITEHVEFMKRLKRENLGLRIGSHAHLWEGTFRTEADRSMEGGADIVNWVGMTGALMTHAFPQMQGDRLLERIHEAISYAKSLNAFTAIGIVCEDIETFHAWVTTARDAGADRLVVYDARGWYTPEVVGFLVRYAKDLAGHRCEIAVHCHDDYGLATINSIEGIRSGAAFVDVTVNRTGHRCGNAALEQVAVALEALYGIPTGLNLTKIQALSDLVAKVYGIPVAANAPMVGQSMFSYSGFRLNMILRGDWFVGENVRAEIVGATRTLIYGPTALHRGPSSPIAVKMRQMGFEVTPHQLDHILDRLEEQMRQKFELSDAEVEALIRETIGA